MDSVWTQAELAVIDGDQYQIEVGHGIVKQGTRGGPTHYFVVEGYGKLLAEKEADKHHAHQTTHRTIRAL